MLSSRSSLQIWFWQVENEWVEKDVSWKHESKGNRTRYINIRQSRFQSKENYGGGGYYITIKVLIHEEESNLKYVYTKQQNCRMVKQELKEMKGKIDFQL